MKIKGIPIKALFFLLNVLMISVLIIPSEVEGDYSGVGLSTIDTQSMMMDQRQNKIKTPEEKLQFIQEYYLREMFLKHTFNSDSLSLLSEEERAEFTSPMESKMQNDMLINHFAEVLAKQDILQFKKRFLDRLTAEEALEVR